MTDSNPLKLHNSILDNYSSEVETMEIESGDKSNPIWLLINPKYSYVQYDIWTPILEEIQDRVYRKLHARIAANKIYIRSTVSDIRIVSNSSPGFVAEVPEVNEITSLKDCILLHQPKILITFGTVISEYVRRIFEIRPERGPKYWSTTNLQDEFERSIANFDINKTNRIPLPRRVVKSSKSLEDCFSIWQDSDNYFREVGTKLADRIIENKDRFDIWI